MDCPRSRDRMARCARGHGRNQPVEHERHSVPSFPQGEGAAPPSYGGEKSDIDQPPLDSLIQDVWGSGYRLGMPR